MAQLHPMVIPLPRSLPFQLPVWPSRLATGSLLPRPETSQTAFPAALLLVQMAAKL